jgi:hypothetical protein
MTQRRHYLESAARKDANQYPVADSSPPAPSGVAAGKHCAYNQTRECFLGSDVEAADFSVSRLPSLAADSGAGLWLVPFLGISPTSVRIPVDLIYLDRHCTVLDTVESFPLSRVSASSPAPASVLVLPAETLRSTETQPGDQLILCPANEMKQRLQKLTSPAETGTEASATAGQDANARAGAFRLLLWEDRSRSKNPLGIVHDEDRTRAEIASKPAAVAPEPQQVASTLPAALAPAIELSPAKPARGWLQRLLSPEPPQPRKAQRESMPGLSVFFFTGGAPVAHGVRDISLTGMFVLTQERWYPGTMVRMTLTDSLDPVSERSITLNTTVVRADDEGVGLRFVLRDTKDRRSQLDGMGNYPDAAQMNLFIQRLRSARS